jgi:hypothetical protein
MERITEKDLTRLVERINKKVGTPLTPWTTIDGRIVPNAGNYHLAGAYGGWKLVQMENSGSGEHCITESGYVPRRQLLNEMQMYLAGLTARTDNT